MSVKEKFVNYLTEGMPIHIPDDEVVLFYKSLKSFIDDANNDFMAFYLEGDEDLIISDINHDYLRVCYEDDKIIFKHAQPGSLEETPDQLLIAGQAFLGVLVFIESIVPSEDAVFIESRRYDKW
tara:strand:+ start:274 stop:645 length:372 start_codon:yes stop_codon:yes gene_type:complete